jgi:hypothetical protein
MRLEIFIWPGWAGSFLEFLSIFFGVSIINRQNFLPTAAAASRLLLRVKQKTGYFIGCWSVNRHEVLAAGTLGLVYITPVQSPLYNIRVQHGDDTPITYYDHKESSERIALLAI